MVNMAGSNQGASSAYTEAGPPEMMIALAEEREGKVALRGETRCDDNAERREDTIPVALLSDGEGRGLQREDLRAHAQLSHPPVDHLAVLGPGVQNRHRPLE